jgi:DNA-binding HxlR family transcriptional regulator
MSTRETSKAAFESVKPFRKTHKRQILEALMLFGPSSCEAIECLTGMKHQTCSARIGELRNSGWIYDTGFKETTSSGCPAVVWDITDKGREAIK